MKKEAKTFVWLSRALRQTRANAQKFSGSFFQKRTACLALLLAGCQASQPGTCHLARATVLPLTTNGHHLFTTTVLNGEPTTMILDTGAQETTVTRQAAARLHLTLQPHGFAEGVGGQQAGYQFVAKTFQIGSLHGSGLEMMASDMGLLSRNGEISGLLGDNFLAAYDLDLDLPDHKAILYARIEGCSKPSAVLSGTLYGLPLVQSYNPNDHRPRVHVQIDGKTLTALVDSGASHTLVFRDAARRLGLRLADLATDPHFRAGGIGPDQPDAVRHVLTPVTVGDLTVRNMPAAIVDQASLGQDEMLLGLDFLSRVHAWFSFSSHTLIMQFPPQPSPP